MFSATAVYPLHPLNFKHFWRCILSEYLDRSLVIFLYYLINITEPFLTKSCGKSGHLILHIVMAFLSSSVASCLCLIIAG
jgi:hypothetical protein